MKSTGYSTKITAKVEKYIKSWERKTKGWVFTWLLACSLHTDKEIYRVSLLETVLLFLTNQAAWFCSSGIVNLIFSREFHVAIPQMDLSNIFDKTLGRWT